MIIITNKLALFNYLRIGNLREETFCKVFKNLIGIINFETKDLGIF